MKRYRDLHKSGLEGQLGVFAPGDLPEGEKILASAESLPEGKKGRNEGNSLADGGKGSMASQGKESMVSLPDEDKIKNEIDKLVESEEEDDFFLEKIEKSQKMRLNAEKDDNQRLKRQVTTL